VRPDHVPPVVDAGWLRRYRAAVAVADVRWYLDGRSGRDAFADGHLPGAVFVDLDRWLAAPPSPADGRHPLPEPTTFADGIGRLGIGDATPVVAYDDAGGGTAARLVWLLRVVGHPAGLLDGGLQAWDEPLSRVAPVVVPATATPRAWPAALLADADDVAAAVDAGVAVIDARAPERYAGEVEPVDPRAGHIPGAVNVPFAGTVDDHGRFLPVDRLRARYRDAGVDDDAPAIAYCGSGVTACHSLVAMEHAGLPAGRLYAGSWSQWSADPARPAAP
jgi:thiosulfate/3-mercaptopyruvate sulfurtransferase